MTGDDPDPDGGDEGGEERQATLEEQRPPTTGALIEMPQPDTDPPSDDASVLESHKETSGLAEDADHEQASIDESLGHVDPEQCEAIAESTGERCQHPAMGPFPYCGDHKGLLSDVDLERMGLKTRNSEG